MTTEQEKVYGWFEKERGINRSTLDEFGVRLTEAGDVVLPYDSGEKIRPNPTKPLGERPRFSFTKGRTPTLFGKREGGSTAFLCEGETDTMVLWQALRAEGVDSDVYGIGGLHTWRRDFADQLSEYSTIWVVLDNDSDYKIAATVDHVWLHQIRHDLGTKAKRLRLPDGVKDLCEFFQVFDVEMLRELSQTRTSRFRPLDLQKEPPPVDWLLEGLIARGDVTLWAGSEGLGKSWISMALAVAVANGWSEVLGLKVCRSGRALYVDEENPQDVVYHRLRKLGMKDSSNIRYLWNNGIRLDKNPDDFIAEAIDFQPEIIVLDSLSRLHSLEENDMGSIGPLFNEVLKPLARESGAAVFLIHHHDKAGNGPRGSGDITASVDSVINCYPTSNDGEMRVHLKKSRRRLGGDEMVVKITDRPDGSVFLDATSYSSARL